MNLSQYRNLGDALARDGMVFEDLCHPQGKQYIREAASSYSSSIPWNKIAEILRNKTGINFVKRITENTTSLESKFYDLLVFQVGSKIEFQININKEYNNINIERDYNSNLDYIELAKKAGDIILKHLGKL
jgi:hypothetical protein